MASREAEKISAPPAARRWLGNKYLWALSGLVLLSLYFALIPLVENVIIFPKADQGKPGWRVEHFSGQNQGRTSREEFVPGGGSLAISQSNSSLTAYSVWLPPQGGTYSIRLRCDDYGALSLDGEPIIKQKPSVSAGNLDEVKVQLSASPHLLVVNLVNGPGKGWAAIEVKGPGDEGFSLLKKSALAYPELGNINSWVYWMTRLGYVPPYSSLPFARLWFWLLYSLAFILSTQFLFKKDYELSGEQPGVITKNLPIWFAGAANLALCLAQLRLVHGDLFNSYPFMFDDSLDWLMQGSYMVNLLSGESLAPLHMLRDPGFVFITALDQLAGGSGYVGLPVLAMANFAGAYFLVRSIRLVIKDPRMDWLAVLIYVLHPALSFLRLYVLSDQLALGLTAGSFYFAARWLKTEERADYLKSAAWAALAGLTQKYGLIPFLIATCIFVLNYGISNLKKELFAKAIAIAVLPLILFYALTAVLVPHVARPLQLQLLQINFTSNWQTYLNFWDYHFLFLLPLAAIVIFSLWVWIKNRVLVFALITFIAFQSLAYFYQSDDGRFVTYGYVSLLCGLLGGLGAFVARYSRLWPCRLLTAAGVVISLLIFSGQLAHTPARALRPGRAEARPYPWVALLAKAAPTDRLSLKKHCPSYSGRLCLSLPEQRGSGRDKLYFFNYYRCLKTKNFNQMKKYQRSDQTRALIVIK